MRKAKRLWIKQEKRIIKLIYKKGLIPDKLKLKEFYWAEYHITNKRHKSRTNKKYKHSEYFPELHYSTVDYYGECDEHGLVDCIMDLLYWSHVIPSEFNNTEIYPDSKFKIKSRRRFIYYLNGLKTINQDNKINKLLKITEN